MELRHLKCFTAVAEELHFARAAERLHIEQSPLSRAIKELEADLGVRLFERTTRSTRLTRAGQLFKEHVPRVLAAVSQARESVKAVAAGYYGQLRISLSDSFSPTRFSALLGACRVNDPDVEVRLFEVGFNDQVRGIRNDLYDLGFAYSCDVDDALVAEPAWSDRIMVVVPTGHPLLAYKRVPIEEVLRYPLILCHPASCEGCAGQLTKTLQATDLVPTVAERVSSHELMISLVAAGYGLGFATEAHMAVCGHPEVVARPFAGRSPMLTTYLLRRSAEPSEELRRFLDRINSAEPDTEALAS